MQLGIVFLWKFHLNAIMETGGNFTHWFPINFFRKLQFNDRIEPNVMTKSGTRSRLGITQHIQYSIFRLQTYRQPSIVILSASCLMPDAMYSVFIILYRFLLWYIGLQHFTLCNSHEMEIISTHAIYSHMEMCVGEQRELKWNEKRITEREKLQIRIFHSLFSASNFGAMKSHTKIIHSSFRFAICSRHVKDAIPYLCFTRAKRHFFFVYIFQFANRNTQHSAPNMVHGSYCHVLDKIEKKQT